MQEDILDTQAGPPDKSPKNMLDNIVAVELFITEQIYKRHIKKHLQSHSSILNIL
ncbi:hypothetical protein ACFPFV_07495 [Salinicoccus siamensis]|uniref:Uncharacterized protein n=1 Tax=Salinicoccus siamensis TaxID=381830 RepID=A0ABV5Z4E9_9STAP